MVQQLEIPDATHTDLPVEFRCNVLQCLREPCVSVLPVIFAGSQMLRRQMAAMAQTA